MSKDTAILNASELGHQKEIALFDSLLAQVDARTTKVSTLFHVLNTLEQAIESETDPKRLATLVEKAEVIQNKVDSIAFNNKDTAFYNELSDYFDEVHRGFAPPEIYKRHPDKDEKNFVGKRLYTGVKRTLLGWLGKHEKAVVIDDQYGAESEFFSKIADTKDESQLDSEIAEMSEDTLKQHLLYFSTVVPRTMILDVKRTNSDEFNPFLTVYRKLAEEYVARRQEKIKTVLAKSQRFGYKEINRIYEKAGLLENFSDSQEDVDVKFLKIFMKEYLSLFNRLQLIYDMKWADFGSKVARVTLMRPRELISNLQVLLGEFRDKHDMIDKFWPKEVGRHLLTWELEIDNPNEQGLKVHRKNSSEELAGESVKIVLKTKQWQSAQSGLVRTRISNGKRYFLADAIVDGEQIKNCVVEVTEAFTGVSDNGLVEISGSMDVIDAKQKSSDRDLSARAWGSYPSLFELTPEYQKKMQNIDEAILVSNIIQRKLKALRIDRKENPHVTAPLQRKEFYSVILYVGDKRKKILFSEASLQLPKEEFYNYLVQQGQHSFSSFDHSASARQNVLENAYNSRNYIQDVQKEIADPNNFEAADFCLVLADENDFKKDFDDVLSDIRLCNNGVKILDSMALVYGDTSVQDEDYGKGDQKAGYGFKQVITLTNHSSADGKAQVVETEAVFQDSMDLSLDMTQSRLRDNKRYKVTKYQSIPIISERDLIGEQMRSEIAKRVDQLDRKDFSDEKRREIISGVYEEFKAKEAEKIESLDEFNFPIDGIRDMIDAQVGETGQSLFEFYKERYGIKLSLSNLLPFVDAMIAGSERWTFLVEKSNARLVPATIFFPKYLQDQVKIADVSHFVEQIDLENMALQFKHFEMDKQNIQNDEGIVSTFGIVAANGLRILSRMIGAVTDPEITDVVQHTGMNSCMTQKGKGFDFELNDEGKKVYKFPKGALQQRKFATAVDSFCRLGVFGATEYLEKIKKEGGGVDYKPYLFVSFRQSTRQETKRKVYVQDYKRNLELLLKFFHLAANRELNQWG